MPEGLGPKLRFGRLHPICPSYDQNQTQPGCRGCECNRLFFIMRRNFLTAFAVFPARPLQ